MIDMEMQYTVASCYLRLISSSSNRTQQLPVQESNLYIYHYVYRQIKGNTTSLHKPQHHQQQPPTNIELIEEDHVLSLVETDNTHIIIYPKAVQWNPPRGKLPPSTMFCVSLTEMTCVFT